MYSVTTLLLISLAQPGVQKAQQLVYKHFTSETCRVNPCQNDGRCIPGKLSCQCTQGWMGRFCHRKCRNIYKSCERWAAEDKCHAVLTQTNFFDVNCALACNLCKPDSDHDEPEVPLAPALEPLQFFLGRWYSQVIRELSGGKRATIPDGRVCERVRRAPGCGACKCANVRTSITESNYLVYHLQFDGRAQLDDNVDSMKKRPETGIGRLTSALMA